MIITTAELAKADINDLLNYLETCELEQNKILEIYIKAANVSEEMKFLKTEEKNIRRWLSIKVGVPFNG